MADRTILEALRRGDVPATLEKIASDEGLQVGDLVEAMLNGTAAVPYNRGRYMQKPCVIGAGSRVKVNANIGTSIDYAGIEDEMAKLRSAIDARADAVMDLSTGGPIDRVREAVLENSPVPVGSVPIYQAAVRAQEEKGGIINMTPDDMFRAIEDHCRSGIDFITVHCGVTMKVLETLRANPRVADIVSRGGAFLAGWMLQHQKENPLYSEFDRLLDIARAHEVTLSLGDGLRPGCIEDATDPAQVAELMVLGELVKRCREAGVQCMVEGPGHVPLNEVEVNIRMAKAITGGAPFYVLGPLVTDVAAGYDHITAAIGGALAGLSGADFLCYVTPREHLGLPTEDDVREGVIVTRIAAHAADVARGFPGARDWDLRMSRARKALDWEAQMKLALDPVKARRLFGERQVEGENACTMCGDFCAMRFIGEYLGREEIVACD
ncbi:MAG: phosphomethylpyrimidine synthase [Candidatus Solincola sediminis]|uniref:Phosphomethylpyrimidine synthase n=1 Tax=Candidatus Solincola sediminis TaxID=1797199 RepID=A0A1F2WFW0_9ACTN|nr:MAG: phosphomethylpyrimidine synthase [Candidatus Solincola sediminis]